MTEEIGVKIAELINDAHLLIPSEPVPDLPSSPYTIGASEWHDFEHKIWKIGEDIRQLFTKQTVLRSDIHLQAAILDICIARNAKRGRQSFVSLLGYKSCIRHAPILVSEIDDPSVEGHIIDSLLKMGASQYINEVRPFVKHETTWIRKKAITYCERFGIAE